MMEMIKDPDTAKSQRHAGDDAHEKTRYCRAATSLHDGELSPRHRKAPRFWRDDALPFIEARAIADGREVYTRHAHEHFSIGAITAGRSTYVHEQSRFEVSTGTVVLMNPAMSTPAIRSTTSPGRT
jgi:hypothetical protein